MRPTLMLSAFLVASVIPGGAFAQATPQAIDDPIPTANGNAVIHPIGHASLMITWNGKRILVDPAPSGGGGGRGGGAARGGGGGAAAAPGGRAGAAPAGQGARGGGGGRGGGTPTPPSPEALAVFTSLGQPDLVVVTHTHGDHLNAFVLSAVAGPNTVLAVPQAVFDVLLEPLKAKATVMANGDRATLAGVDVQAVPMYNITPERQNHPKGVGNGYVLTLGGVRFYFAGDTEGAPELRALANIDVAFIPMNLPFTQTPEAAAEWVRAMRPRIVYPYHYSNGDITAFVTGVGTASEVRLRKWY